MFKFLWKLLKKIQANCTENIVYVENLANTRMKNECKVILEKCCEEAGEEYKQQYMAIVQTCIKTVLEQNPSNLDNLLLLLTQEFQQNKQLKANTVAINNYFKPKRKKYYSLLCEWHFQLAIADILLGQYEELDPIIGDQACEMRCPFLLDVIRVVIGNAETFEGEEGKGYDYLQTLAKRVFMDGHKIPTDNPRELNIRAIEGFLQAIPEDFTAFCLLCKEILDNLDGPTKDEFLGLPAREDGVPYSYEEKRKEGTETFEKTIDIVFPQYNKIKELDLIDVSEFTSHTFKTSEYLRLCKTFTRNREALIDEFGIDIDHESTLLYYDVAQKQKYPRYKLKDLNRETSDYEKQMLAHCSSAYMKYAARKLRDTIGGKSLFTSVYDVFNGCKATINGSGFLMNVLPVYDAFRVILGHAAKNRDPIVVNLTRMIVIDGDTESPKFQHQKSWVLYYEPNENGKFIYVSEPSLKQKRRPAIAVVASSVVNPLNLCTVETVKGAEFINELDAEKFLTGFTKCDVGHMLMLFGANHPTFPSSTCIPQLKLLDHQVIDYTQKKPGKLQTPDFIWITPVNLQSKAPDCGRDYARRILYVECTNAPLDDYPSNGYQFSMLSGPCPLFVMDSDNETLAWEYDYYLRLTEALGLTVESVKYALMDGGRDSHEGDTWWKRNLDTLPFTPTHMYVTTFDVETDHQNRIEIEDEGILDITIQKSTMGRKSSKFKITYDIKEIISNDEDF